MLPLLILACVALLALHFSWRRRFRREQERIQAEQARLAREQQTVAIQNRARQEALLDSMVEGVVVLDEGGCIQMANRAFTALFGSATEPRGKTLIEALRLHEVAELAAQVAAEGRVLGYELRLPGLNAQWLEINGTALLDRDGNRQGAILVFHDLSRLKQLERTREEFVANVSHELRTPLSLIKGYVETLLDGAKDNPEVAKKFLQIIERNARRLELLIQDLLTISELESGRVRLNLQAVLLRPVVEKVFADFKVPANARSVRLVNALPELAVQADPDRLEQVIANLVDNAVKYGRVGGTVTVSGHPIENGSIEICVQDDGPGIPAESLERIFERFYRVDKARSREQGGTGLGLSIVKHIVQSHGGRVWAKSELGQGAAFFFALGQGQGGVQPELIHTSGN